MLKWVSLKASKLPRPNQAKKIPKSLPMWDTPWKLPLFCNLPLCQVAYLNQVVCPACFISNMERSDYITTILQINRFHKMTGEILNPIHYVLFKTELNHYVTNNIIIVFFFEQVVPNKNIVDNWCWKWVIWITWRVDKNEWLLWSHLFVLERN